jgi:hypothetical protein
MTLLGDEICDAVLEIILLRLEACEFFNYYCLVYLTAEVISFLLYFIFGVVIFY